MGVEALRAELLDQALPMPRRFRALFGLRSVGGEAAVQALLDSLKDPSALFRHEVAFALGQMQVTSAVAASRLCSATGASTVWCATRRRRRSAPSPATSASRRSRPPARIPAR